VEVAYSSISRDNREDSVEVAYSSISRDNREEAFILL
jgi:hypothetical protein